MIFGRFKKEKNPQGGNAPQEAPLQGYPAPAPQSGFAAGQGPQTGGYGAGMPRGAGTSGAWFPQNQGAGYSAAGGNAAPGNGMNPSAGVPYPQNGAGYAGYPQGGTPGAWPQAQAQAAGSGYSWSQTSGASAPYAGQGAQYAQRGGYAAQNPAYAQNYAQAGGNGMPQTPYPTGGTPVSQAPYPAGGNAMSQASWPAGGNAPYATNPGYSASAPYAPGYAAGGYPPQGQPQGYNVYPQMGRTQPRPPVQPAAGQPGQIPLNGGGYVPPAVPVRKQPFVFDNIKLILLGAGLLALFVAGFVTGIDALLWIFTAFALATTVLFWVQPLIESNKRLCYTIIFAALAAVAIVRVAGLIPANGTSDKTNQTETAAGQESSGSQDAGGQVVIDPKTGEAVATVDGSAPTATPTAPPEDTSAVDRLESFFRYWSANKYDDMLTLCAPSWLSSTNNPKSALFGLIANRTPLDYSVEKISGTPDDTSRTVTVASTLDRNNGKDPVKYRLSVLMVKDTLWYVDPQSLKTYEEAETQDPATVATPTPTVTPPTPGNTLLYYNPDGGTKYHLDPNCKSTHAKYLPFKGKFKYSEINDAKYANLEPCNVCAAPLRPTNN